MSIRVFFEPKVTLLTRQVFVNPLEGQWETDAPSAGEAVAEFAGRLCYLSFGKDVDVGGHTTINGRQGNAPYLSNIRAHKHGSVMEHAVYGLLFEQISRALTHELVRHRAGMSYSQLSQRYVDESQVGSVCPPEIKPDTDTFGHWLIASQDALRNYAALLAKIEKTLAGVDDTTTMKRKRARQSARALLPNATETKIVVTGNARSWRHFLALRGAEGADDEIRNLAVVVARMLKKESPNMFADVEITNLDNGKTVVTVNDGSV